jgi:hypothetical protein
VSIANTAGVAASDDPDWLTVYHGKLFFVALNASGAAKLYVYDEVGGTGVRQVADLAGSANTDFAFTGATAPKRTYDPFFTEYNGRLYFRANTAATGGPVNTGAPKLFAFDDATGSLYQVANILGNGSADLDWTLAAAPVVYGTRMGIMMNDSAGHAKVYSLCDATAGCVP